METNKLMPTHMVRFHEFLLQRKREKKNSNGEYECLSRYSVYKIMVKLRAYVHWLESERLLGDLKPIDIPVGNIPRPMPKCLAKEEIKKMMSYLDTLVETVATCENKCNKYNAYLDRAIVRFLYTTGLRNAELRTLKLHDINVDELTGAVV